MSSVQQQPSDLKLRTARTLKWNVVDRVLSQLLYAVTGIVLARELSQADFGLVGAVLIFQAFASLLIDSGFSYALIQRKNPTRLDYSSVLWFNLVMAAVLYAALWVCAPWIAQCFDNDARLIPLSRVMFLCLIVNAAGIVQTNRFNKSMNVRPVALSNAVGLAAGAVTGIVLALRGYGAWAVVWQTLVSATVKTVLLWILARWVPMLRFSFTALRSFMHVGLGMMATSFLNTLFQNIYSFFIGSRVGLAPLGYYTQSNKWSTMGIASLSQTLTSSTLPVLSGVQDDAERFRRMVHKFNRMTAYLLFPFTLGAAAVALPLFHVLFGTKWDPSVWLFQLLMVRGIFTVLTGLYTNYLLALGRSKAIVALEAVRDAASLGALVLTFGVMGLTTPTDPVYGLGIMLQAQLGAVVVAWIVTLTVTARTTGVSLWRMVLDLIPCALLGAATAAAALAVQCLHVPDLATLLLGIAAGALFYITANALLGSKVQSDALAYLRGRL